MSNFTNTIKSIKSPLDGFAMVYFPKTSYVSAVFVGIALGVLITGVNYTCKALLNQIDKKLDDDRAEVLADAVMDAENEVDVIRQECSKKDEEIVHLKDDLKKANERISLLEDDLVKAYDKMTILVKKNTEILMILGHQHSD
jgi:hypothetical protein